MANRNDSSSTSLGESLEEINDAHTQAYIPVIIFVILIIIVGLVSNTLAFIFYSNKVPKSSSQYFISAISLNDGLVNLTLIEDSVALFRYVKNDYIIVCKLYYFFIHWFVGNSLLLIVAIGVDRFRRVVFPFARQIRPDIAKNIVAGILLFSLTISVHYFYTCSIERLDFSNGSNVTVVGHLCSLSQEHPQAIVKKTFHIIDICLHVASIGFLIICYTVIVRKLVSSRNRIRSNIQSSTLADTERTFSITAFVITVASIICFVPYYVNMLTSKPNLDGKSLVHSVTDMLTRRSYMLNSTVNPLIMLYFNSSFREFVVNILCCVCKKCRIMKN